MFHKEKFPESFYGKDTHSRCMLALGAVSHKLSKEGTIHRARRAVEWAHSFLGLHGKILSHLIKVIAYLM